MRYVNAMDAARVGVFAWRRADGRPAACAVTPYVDGDDVVVSSTLALLGKVADVRRDGRVALLAGGVLVRGRADVVLDLHGRRFDAVLRAQELRKFPPSRALLRLPGHRRLLWWYVGRALVRLHAPEAVLAPGDDRVALALVADDGLPCIVPARAPGADAAVPGDRIPLALPVGDGPASLLLHDEDETMADLRQLRLDGVLRHGALHVASRTGSLARSGGGTWRQLTGLLRLAAAARRNRVRLARWHAAAGEPG